mgnify:CR=1 FL=1
MLSRTENSFQQSGMKMYSTPLLKIAQLLIASDIFQDVTQEWQVLETTLSSCLFLQMILSITQMIFTWTLILTLDMDGNKTIVSGAQMENKPSSWTTSWLSKAMPVLMPTALSRIQSQHLLLLLIITQNQDLKEKLEMDLLPSSLSDLTSRINVPFKIWTDVSYLKKIAKLPIKEMMLPWLKNHHSKSLLLPKNGKDTSMSFACNASQVRSLVTPKRLVLKPFNNSLLLNKKVNAWPHWM